jgi:hypothetical protein
VAVDGFTKPGRDRADMFLSAGTLKVLGSHPDPGLIALITDLKYILLKGLIFVESQR